ncbi:uncharacterized protein LOC134183157 [Corticium candelabrum]|uniref:uncharacterized protein LOC134183157 n=1 Tax=Corticium candelabrum TaxID=121492 RepID=UPI002E258363|nr:uncharacterized protein LOC134183157 [Corticium candelabrum]
MAGALSESEAADAAAVQLQQFKLEEMKRDKTLMASKERQDAAFRNKLAERQKQRQQQQMIAEDEVQKKDLAAKNAMKVNPPKSTNELTFVSVKVKNLTTLWESLDANLVNSSLQLYKDAAQHAAIEHQGYIVSNSVENGHGLIAFATAISAVHWSLTLQCELLKVDWPAELLLHSSCKELVLDSNPDVIVFRGLSVQMGIDRGNVQAITQGKSDVTYTGLAVHRSNNLCNTAQGGQILVSVMAWNAITVDSIAIDYQANNLGTMKLDDVTKPVEVLEIYPKDVAARSKILGLSCAGCNHPIQPGQEFLKAMGYKWHVEHFCCEQCGKALQGSFIAKDGIPYCEEDFYEMTATKCKGCGQTINAAFIESLGGLWHPQCFVCQKCKRLPSENDNIYELNSMPYCESCYVAQHQ